jgi:hypothetical protein
MMKKKPMAPKPRATKRGTPVPMPKMPSKGPMARMTDQAKLKPVKKIITSKQKITRKPVTERQLLDVKNMTPAEKMAYIKRGKRGF